MNRRSLITAGLGIAVVANAPRIAVAQTTIEFVSEKRPSTTHGVQTGLQAPSFTAWSELTAEALVKRSTSSAIPAAYQHVALAIGVPAAALFGIAKAESAMMFKTSTGKTALPWPWTTNTRGVPARYTSRADAESALMGHLQRGEQLVDVGLMQVNWYHHKARLVAPEKAFDPLFNLQAGAAILKACFEERKGDTTSWQRAIGAYHSPGNPVRAASYAGIVARQLRGLHA